MIALLQRVKQARVEVDQNIVGQIEQGLLVFTGFQPADDETEVERQLERILNYRLFADEQDRMNRSLRDIQGGLLLVPQFTLAADTTKGRRPSFTSAASPAQGERLFDFIARRAQSVHPVVATGEFGADMQVYIQNDGPVTFLLQ
ncbi:MAG: D-aminoacyl-tRNA deacylase [Gammaproteobacteria bacterium]|nr:D-aminoacyl-tRNA deacylase [Gammaproteobacteria bacterium]